MLRDQINLLTKLTPSKIANALSVLVSYYLSRFLGTKSHGGLPLFLGVEPTTACNLRCPECPSGLRSFTRPTGKLDLSLLEKILGEVKDHCISLNFYFQGEPYLHPQFLDMAKMCKDYNIYSSTSTNAHFLDSDKARKTVESGLDRLIISVDGTDQATYSSYRREGKLAKVIEGTRNVVHWKKQLRSSTPHVIFQFLVVKPNQHQIGKVKRLGRELGVDEVRLKTAQIYDFEDGNELIPTLDKYSRYKQGSDGKWKIKNPLDNHCWRMWSGAEITWDGKMIPCCFDKNAQHTMGNLQKQSVKEIWNNTHYREFRRKILTSRSEVEMCKNCSEGTQVWAD